MQIKEINFLEYLSAEEHNLLASIINFQNEFHLFHNLDEIYRKPLSRLIVYPEEQLCPQLYLFVHFHLYFSISSFLRCHLSESFSSTRKAIDATLTAYKIILEPGTSNKYMQRDPYFQYIKNNIQKEIKKDSSKYPLAHKLIKIHDSCSQFGSHADISSFIHRLKVENIPGTKKERVLLSYHQFPKKPEEHRFYFIVVLQSFYLMFQIFKLFLDANLKILDINWEQRIKTLGPELEKLRKRYYSQIKNEKGKP